MAGVEPTLRVATEGEPDIDGFRSITLTTECADDLGERLLRALLAESLRVRALSRAHPTLEDLFLAATRRSWDTVAPDPSLRRRP
jgi:ABC-2 type transport system ATP-binding protein